MAKSAYEKALEKQTRETKKAMDKQNKETKKLADQEARRQRASAIVNGQAIVGGMRIMDAASEELLTVFLDLYDGNEEKYVHGNYDVIPKAYYNSLLLEFEKLSMYGVVSSPHVWINAMWEATLTPQGITYFEDKKEAQEKEKAMRSPINIGSITATGSNIVIGDVINSTFSVDNSVTRIEQEIEEKGGEDKEELKDLLEEVKELIENMQDSRHIPKNKGLFSRLSDHLEKHGWFYGEVVGLIGAAALQLLQG